MKDGEPDRPAAILPEGADDRRGDRVEEQAPDRAGVRMRAAREAQGLTLAEVAQRTRVPLRHLEAVEASDFAALPSPTYAVGFARAYARAVGVDEVAVARDVRGELSQVERAPKYVPYETADPDRVPSRGLAIFGLGLALAILILAGLYYGTDVFRPGSAEVAGGPATGAMPVAADRPVAAPTPAAPRQVSLAAGEQEVWLRVYDADNATLYLGTLAPGAKFDVPPTANRPMINVGRPDQLRVTIDGRPVPPLGDGRRAIKDVAVDAASLAARLSGTPAAGASSGGAGRNATPSNGSVPGGA
jgi:transcriptional regulator with XRE-family HTH domain